MTPVVIDRDDWKGELRRQGRSLAWLARATGRPPATVYAYSCGARIAPPDFVASAWRALGYPELAEAA